MQIYRGKLELLDYVFFSTVEKGKVYETGAFIHNYALVYSLGLVRGNSYTYASIKQQPLYQSELTPLNGSFYLTPGTPDRISYRLIQWNTIPDRYAFPGKVQSAGYPDWGFARMLRPGSEFTLYLMTGDFQTMTFSPALSDLLSERSVRIRLGKFPAKARLSLRKPDKLKKCRGSFQVDTYLNWRDLEMDPIMCDVVSTSLPTRLIHHAAFENEDYYEAEFTDEVIRIPTKMRFMTRPL